MRLFKYLLLPFSWLYALGAAVIDYFYKNGIYSSSAFSIPVIAVGNLNAGGSGKTPMVMYLAEYLMQNNYKVAILSRGYRRKTFGYRLASEQDDYTSIGDEPEMMRQLLPDAVIAVAENRLLAIPYLLADHPEIEVILLDDAYQQRSIRPALNILLTNAGFPFFKDYFLPFGRLREKPQNADRADIIIFTKKENPEKDIAKKIAKENPACFSAHQEIFCTGLQYDQPYHWQHQQRYLPMTKNAAIVAFAGIADEKPLQKYLEKKYTDVTLLKYPDHHKYTSADLEKIFRVFQHKESQQKFLLCTEKDAVKLALLRNENDTAWPDIFVLPVKIDWGTSAQENEFKAIIKKKMDDYYPDKEIIPENDDKI